MTLDTRARRAAQGIRNAVEVMEMSTSTKELRTVERFDRFRDRKQRNRRIGALVVVAMLVIATVVVATNALDRGDKVPVTHPSQNGRIVFGEQQGQWNGHPWPVYTMNPDGTDVRALSVSWPITTTGSTPVKSECMSWTAGGSKIFIDQQGRSGLATTNPDGTGYTELSTPFLGISATGCEAALSPDGTRVVGSTVASSSVLGNGIYTVRASDGGDLVRLTHFSGPETNPSYSPDGAQIVFNNQRGSSTPGLFVVNADGTGLHLIAPHLTAAGPYSWSPDGGWILFSDGAAVYVVHPDGTGLRRITLESVPRLRRAMYPSWSPDGTRFVFVGWTGSDRYNLFTARMDGTDVEQITHTHGIYYRGTDWGTNTG